MKFLIARGLTILIAETRNEARRFRTLGSLGELDEIAAQWTALESRAATPLAYFQTYDWCRNWVAAYADQGSGIEPRIETLWHGDRLVAVWPLMTITSGGVRLLKALGDPHSQYCNLIASSALTEADARALLARIEKGGRYDVAVFDLVPETSPVASLLRGRPPIRGYANSSSVLDLSHFANSDAYVEQQTRTQRRNRNRRRNALSRLGAIDFEVVWPDHPDFAPLVRQCAAMKRRWLVETGRYSTGFGMAGYDDFLAGLTGDAVTMSGACLSVLRTGDRVAALELGFIKDGHYYAYIGGFDWDLRQHSPGKVQMEMTVAWLIDNGVAAYDLLGNPAQYKDSWSNRTIGLKGYALPLSWKGHLYANAWLTVLRPAAKRVYEAVPNVLRRLLAATQSFGFIVLYV